MLEQGPERMARVNQVGWGGRRISGEQTSKCKVPEAGGKAGDPGAAAVGQVLGTGGPGDASGVTGFLLRVVRPLRWFTGGQCMMVAD